MNKLLNKEPDRIEQLVSEKRVKLHVFEPSQRKIWTVVGKGEEHWIDPDGHYCSVANILLRLRLGPVLIRA